MVVQFPVPVLAVAADAVRDLEGRDALSGLWTLFTKCKESLQDGRRLENISWRLWYRELMLLEEERTFNSKLSASLGDDDYTLVNEKETVDQEEEKIAYRPPSPSPTPESEEVPVPPLLPPAYASEDGVVADTLAHGHEESPRLRAASSTSPSPPPPPQPSVSPLPSSPAPPPIPSTSPLLTPASSEHKRRPSSSSSASSKSTQQTQPHSRRNSFVNGIGKIIAEMLPGSASASGSSSSLSVTSLNSTSLSSLEAGAGKVGIHGGLGAALFLPGPVLTRQSTSSSITSRSSSDSAGSSESSSSGDAEPNNDKINSDSDLVAVSPATQLRHDPTMRMTRISPSLAGPSSPASPPTLDAAAAGRPRRCSIPQPAPSEVLQAQAQNQGQTRNDTHNHNPSCLPTPDMETEEPGLRMSARDMNTTALASSSEIAAPSSSATSSSSSGSGSSSSGSSSSTVPAPTNSFSSSAIGNSSATATVAISQLSGSDSDSAYSLSLAPSISTTTTTTTSAATAAGNNPDAYPPPELQLQPQHTLHLQPPLQPLSQPPLQLQPAYTGPPSPSFSDGYIQAHPGEAEEREFGLLPSLSGIGHTLAAVDVDVNRASTMPMQTQTQPESQLLSLSSLVASTATPPSTSSLQIPVMNAPSQPDPPKLVVVNPTPNPTPHPTPPATPLLGSAAMGTIGIGPGGVIRTQYLALPPGAVGSGAGMRQREVLAEAQRQMEEMRRAGRGRVEGLRLPVAHAGGSASSNAASGVAMIAGAMPTDRAIDRSRSTVPTTGSGGFGLINPNPARPPTWQRGDAAEEAAADVIPSAAGSAGEGGGDRGEGGDQGGRDAGRVAAREEASLAVSSRAADASPAAGGVYRSLDAEFQSAVGDHQLERDAHARRGNTSTAAARSSSTSLLPPLRTEAEVEREDAATSAAASRRMGNRHSVSSTTTTSSSHSHVTSESATSANTTLFSSEAELVQHPEQQEKIPLNISLNVNKPLGSLSTIQSLATLNDTDKEKEKSPLTTTSTEAAAPKTDVVKEIFDSTSYDIVSNEEAIDDEDRSPLSPLPPPGLLALSNSMAMSLSPRSEKRKKRNSAPPPETTSSALLGVSPASVSSGSGQPLSPTRNRNPVVSGSHSTSTSHSHSHHHPTRRVIAAGGGALTRRGSSGRSTSRSRSTGGSSVGKSKSRSRSREPGAGVGLGVGLGGGLGMTSTAVVVHPPAAAAAAAKKPTVAHAPHIAAGRGRAKVVLSRAAASSKARVALRRNSSGLTGGTAAHATAEALEAELQREHQEREEREKTERMRAEALEKERQRSLESLEDKRRVEAENSRAMRAREEVEERMRMRGVQEAEQRRVREVGGVQAHAQVDGHLGVAAGSTNPSNSKRQLKFNIGSNSDQGSGGDSKSAESASDLSGGRRGGARGGLGVVVEPQQVQGKTRDTGKGKEKQRETEEEMARRLESQLQFVFQQQQQRQQRPPHPNHHDNNHPNHHDQLPNDRDQETLQQHLRRQMSKHQLHQLQKMQALHMQQHQNSNQHLNQAVPAQQQVQQRQPVVLNQREQVIQRQREQEGLLTQQLVQGALDKASTQQVVNGGGHGHTPGPTASASRKGKGKEREIVVLSPKHSKSSSHSKNHAHAHNRNAGAAGPLDDDLATKIKQSLAAPLLPQNKRTIVLTTSESDSETYSEDEEDEDDEDGSWSSEEMGDGDGDEASEQRAREEQLRQQELQRQYEQQQLLQRQRQQQQQHQQHQPPPTGARPGAVQRTQSSHYPAPNANARGGGGRHQRHVQAQAAANAQAMMEKVEKAAREVQRQREMFVKLPTSSLQDLAKARTQSVGLLTQLMHPDPEIFPLDHPYRRGASSGDINRIGMGGRGSGGGTSAGGPMRSGAGGPGAGALGPLTPAVAPRAAAAAPAAVDEGRQTQAQPQPPQAQTQTQQAQRQGHPPPPPPTHQRRNTEGDGQQPMAKRSSDGPAAGPGPARTTFSPPSRALGLQRTKSAAAMPLSSQVLAGSVSANFKAPAPPLIDRSAAMPTTANANVNVNAKANAAGHSHVNANVNVNAHPHAHAHGSSSGGGYRLRGPPEGAELEEESGDEADSGIQVSKSVVQERLKALAQRQGILPTNGNAQRPAAPAPAAGGAAPRTSQPAAHGDDDDVPQWARVSQPPQHHHHPHPLTRSQSQGQTQNRRVQNGLQQLTQIGDAASANSSSNNTQHQHANAAPIPLGFPYNLPLAAQPSTPRTTRRQMLATELPESLRRNLLWERQVTKASGFRRSASGGGSRNSVLGGLQPLTAVPSMVQLHAKGTGPPPANGDGRQARQAPAGLDEREQEEEKRKAMARNKSWANDYHYSGW